MAEIKLQAKLKSVTGEKIVADAKEIEQDPKNRFVDTTDGSGFVTSGKVVMSNGTGGLTWGDGGSGSETASEQDIVDLFKWGDIHYNFNSQNKSVIVAAGSQFTAEELGHPLSEVQAIVLYVNDNYAGLAEVTFNINSNNITLSSTEEDLSNYAGQTVHIKLGISSSDWEENVFTKEISIEIPAWDNLHYQKNAEDYEIRFLSGSSYIISSEIAPYTINNVSSIDFLIDSDDWSEESLHDSLSFSKVSDDKIEFNEDNCLNYETFINEGITNFYARINVIMSDDNSIYSKPVYFTTT